MGQKIMKKLSKIWSDIRKGENIDLFLTVIVSFVLVILNLLGMTSPTLVASLTLAVLGLITLSSLESRYQVQELAQKLDQSSSSLFLSNFPTELDQDVKAAQELWLMGVSLSRTVKNYYSDIEQKLKEGHSVRAILTHPEGAALELSVLPVYGNKSLEQRKAEIIGSLETLCDLRNRYPNMLQIRTSNHYIGHGVIAVDPSSNVGKLYIENHPFKMPGGSRPKFLLEAKDGEWYDFYKREMHVIWEHCSDWDCDQASKSTRS
ncbi:MAG: hypothetical protein MN733_18930 [Nitrososphaera sp.]|nr:hypothetical protein [Nitrososphaera sp.]